MITNEMNSGQLKPIMVDAENVQGKKKGIREAKMKHFMTYFRKIQSLFNELQHWSEFFKLKENLKSKEIENTTSLQ